MTRDGGGGGAADTNRLSKGRYQDGRTYWIGAAVTADAVIPLAPWVGLPLAGAINLMVSDPGQIAKNADIWRGSVGEEGGAGVNRLIRAANDNKKNINSGDDILGGKLNETYGTKNAKYTQNLERVRQSHVNVGDSLDNWASISHVGGQVAAVVSPVALAAAIAHVAARSFLATPAAPVAATIMASSQAVMSACGTAARFLLKRKLAAVVTLGALAYGLHQANAAIEQSIKNDRVDKNGKTPDFEQASMLLTDPDGMQKFEDVWGRQPGMGNLQEQMDNMGGGFPGVSPPTQGV